MGSDKTAEEMFLDLGKRVESKRPREKTTGEIIAWCKKKGLDEIWENVFVWVKSEFPGSRVETMRNLKNG